MKRLLAWFCSFIVLLMSSAAVVCADSQDNTALSKTGQYSGENSSYKEYCLKYSAVPEHETESLSIDAVSYSKISGEGISVLPQFEKSDMPVLKWDTNKEGNSVTWKFNVSSPSRYRIRLTYYALENNSDSVDLGLLINGKYPFDSCAELSFSKVWTNATQEFVKDSAGNEKRPKAKQVLTWQSSFFGDKTGVSNSPYEFVFFEGENEITINGLSTDIILKKIELLPAEKPESYQSYIASLPVGGNNQKADPIIIQCEQTTYRSNSSIIPMEDRGHVETQPSHAVLSRYNTIGDYNWVTQGQWICWEFDVKNSGYYNIGMRVRQNYQRGYASARRVYIDGKVPFEDLDCVEYNYDRNWYFEPLGGKEPFRIYLEEGKHSISMEVIPGHTAELSSVLQESVKAINQIYRNIIMITGTSPDIYRDYCLQDEIPNLVELLTEQRDILKQQYDKLQDLYGGRDSDTATLQRLIAQLTDFIKDDTTIVESISTFSDNISSLASWVVRLKEQPLELDYIEIVPEGTEFTDYSVGFFKKVGFLFKQFIASFVVDYNAVGAEVSSDVQPLNVWVSLGRDQSQLIRELVDNDFSAKYDIPVSVKLSKGSLIQAAFAGTGPDVALFVTSDQPVNLAVREAVLDITKFEGSEELLNQFSKEELVAFNYNGGTYGVPLTADINMMFVRTDVFEQLGLEIPKTWDDMYKILPTLQRNNMNVGLPKVTIEGLGLAVFNSLLLQNGQNYYTEDGSKTAFDTEVALDAFREWTGFYTKYDVPIDYDFYNRFRSGEIPIGIETYTLYNKLAVAAPEITGMWTMVPLPGTEQADGTIDRSTSLSCTAAVILKGCKDKDAAWKFVKWFACAETQGEYGRQIEALIGEAARYNAANILSISELPWTSSESELILDQLNSAKGIPQSIASYYITRNLYNAYRKVAVNHHNPREVLYRYNKQMNDEIERKREEFGLNK